MSVILNPYLNFDGTTRDAMSFYHSIFGGQISFMTYAEGGAPVQGDEANRIMHSMVQSEGGLTLMAADSNSWNPLQRGNHMSVALTGDNAGELQGYWGKLSEGAQVQVALAEAPWGDSFGMLTDKFGTDWLVNIAAPK